MIVNSDTQMQRIMARLVLIPMIKIRKQRGLCLNIYVFSHLFLSNYMKINDDNMHAIIEIKTPRPGIVVLNPHSIMGVA